MKRLLKGGRVVDPANGIDGVHDILIEDGRIARVGRDLPADGATTVEIPSGLVVCPGLIDMHVHLREPGQEHKETVASGVASAVAGGFTAVACMPNTSPVNDNANVTSLILAKAAEATAHVHPIGAVSKGSKGELLADIAELKQAGCVAITDDGHPGRRPCRCGGRSSTRDVRHAGHRALRGCDAQGRRCRTRRVPRVVARVTRDSGAAEALGVERGVLLSELTGSAFHVAHMSARASIRAVRKGKEAGVRVTCEVAPHHFTLTDEALASPIPYDTNTKMNPPLREAADRDAMLAGIVDGTVDAIATDHAPHHYDEKKVEFDRAPFGIVGLETAVPLSIDRLVHAGLIRFRGSWNCRPAPRASFACQAERFRRAVRLIYCPRTRSEGPHPRVATAIAFEEHTVRRLGAARRRRRDHHSRPHCMRES